MRGSTKRFGQGAKLILAGCVGLIGTIAAARAGDGVVAVLLAPLATIILTLGIWLIRQKDSG
jgi:energy-converting hydrogenase Eha subunit C